MCAVPKNAAAPETWEALKTLARNRRLSCAVRCAQIAVRQVVSEVDVVDAEVLQTVHEYPITPKEHGTEFLMDHRHLWLRSRRQHAVLKVRHTVVQAVRNFLDNDGITLCDAPIFTPAA